MASQPHRDRLPANRLQLYNRNARLLQTCLVPTTLPQRSSLVASRLNPNPTPADLQICLAPALLLYIRLPANRPQHRLGIRVCHLWTQTQIVICLTDHQSTSLWKKVNSLIRTRMRLPTPTKHYLRIRPTEKPYSVLDLIWSHIPDIESTTATGDDNPFAGPKSQPAGKVSVHLPTDEWLCNKMAKLNVTLVEDYPSHSSEAGGLLRDQFVRPPSRSRNGMACSLTRSLVLPP